MIFIIVVRVSTLQNKSVQLTKKIKIYNSNQLLGLRTQVLVIKSLKLNSPGALEILEYKTEAANLKWVLCTYLEHQVLEEEWKDQTHLEVGCQSPQPAHPSFFQLELVEEERSGERKVRKAENIK